MRRRQFVQLSLGTVAALWASGCGGSSDPTASFNSGPFPAGSGGAAPRFQFSEDVLFETDGSGRIYQLDPYKGRIVARDASGQELFQADGTTNPFSLGLAGDSRVYVLDRGQGDIAVYSLQGTLERRIGAGQLGGAFQMAVGSQELYLLSATDGAVIVLDLNGTPVRRLTLSDRVFYRDIAVGPSGELHLLQASPPVVQVITPQGTATRSYGPGPGISGRSLSVDAQGRSFIVDAIAGTIQQFDAAGMFIESISRPGFQPLQALSNDNGLFVLVQETT